MRFLMLASKDPSKPSAPLSAEQIAELARLGDELAKSGVILARGGLDPRPARIQSSGGKVTLTDGPFAEAKEVIVGFGFIEAKSREEALEYCKRLQGGSGDGVSTVYQVYGSEG